VATASILRIQAVKAATGLSRSSIYALAKTGEFPSPIQLTQRCIGWRETDIALWLEERRRKGYAPRPRLSSESIIKGVKARLAHQASRKAAPPPEAA
jgi:prophage regulatory protein